MKTKEVEGALERQARVRGAVRRAPSPLARQPRRAARCSASRAASSRRRAHGPIGEGRSSPAPTAAEAARAKLSRSRSAKALGDGPPRQDLAGARRAAPRRTRSRTRPVAHAGTAQPVAALAPSGIAGDPYAELKTRVHHAVIAKLGPELFKRERRPRTSPSACCTPSPSSSPLDRTPLTREERRQIAAGDQPTTSSATARSSRSSATTPSPRSWSTATTGSTSSASGKLERSRHDLRRRRAPAADHRQDRLAGRPPDRRGLADGRRAPARRQPRERDHPAARRSRGRR